MDAAYSQEYREMRAGLQAFIDEIEVIKEQIKSRPTVDSLAKSAQLLRMSSSTTSSVSVFGLTGKGPPLPAPSEPRKMKNTPDLIQASKFLNYFLEKNVPKALVIDCRPHGDFVDLHYGGTAVVNIPPELLAGRPSALQIMGRLSAMSPFHAQNFAGRHIFDIVIFYDASSTFASIPPLLADLKHALINDPSGTLERNPAMLEGGFKAWVNAVKVTPYRSMHALLIDGDVDGKPSAFPRSSRPPSRSSTESSAAASVQSTPHIMPKPVSDGIRRPQEHVVDLNINRSAHDYLTRTAETPSAPNLPLFGDTETAQTTAQLAPAERRKSEFENPYFNFVTSPNLASSPLPPPKDYPTPASYYPVTIQPLSQSYLIPPDRLSSYTLNLNSNVAAPLQKPLIPEPLDINRGNQQLNNLLINRQPLQPPQQVVFQQQQQPPAYTVPSIPQQLPRSSGTSGSLSNLAVYNPSEYESRISELRSSWSSAGGAFGRGFVGLKNLGNTCFMNSILQCLAATRPLAALFIDGSYRKYVNQSNPLSSKGKMVKAFASLLTSMYREENGVVVSPGSFKEQVSDVAEQFQGTEQHDSQEFLAFLLDALHEDLNQGIMIRGGQGYTVKSVPPNMRLEEPTDEESLREEQLPESETSYKAWTKYLFRNDSPLVYWFQGQMMNQLRCQTCGQTSTTYNTFMYLSVPLPGDGRRPVRLEDCINEFCKEETLTDTDSWKCPRCKVPRRATKKLTISRLPIILLIHLKRFSVEGHFRNKLDTFVQFPINNLDMMPFLSKGLQSRIAQRRPDGSNPMNHYDLYAVSNHYGNLNNGHYTATVRHGGRGAWFVFDDTRVSQLASINDVRPQQVCTANAYSLFYVSQFVAP